MTNKKIKRKHREICYKKFETKLLLIYPTLSKKKATIIIKQLFKFWWDIIENIDKLENKS